MASGRRWQTANASFYSTRFFPLDLSAVKLDEL